MKKVEIILLSFLILVFTIYMLGINGLVPVLMISFLILICFYFYFGFAIFNEVGIRKILKKESYTNATFFKILGAIASGIAISIGLMGILFKTLRWPGSIQMLIFGLASLLVISIISTIKLISSKQKYYSVVLKRIIPVLLIVAFYFAMPKYFLVELRYGKNPAYYKAIENYEQNRNDTLLDKK